MWCALSGTTPAWRTQSSTTTPPSCGSEFAYALAASSSRPDMSNSAVCKLSLLETFIADVWPLRQSPHPTGRVGPGVGGRDNATDTPQFEFRN
eukprot:6045532-Pyramimonas_sp.AAC.3